MGKGSHNPILIGDLLLTMLINPLQTGMILQFLEPCEFNNISTVLTMLNGSSPPALAQRLTELPILGHPQIFQVQPSTAESLMNFSVSMVFFCFLDVKFKKRSRCKHVNQNLTRSHLDLYIYFFNQNEIRLRTFLFYVTFHF